MNKTTTLTGTYVLRPNPCTTEPCLPGMAYAVETAGSCYFLTIDGHWLSENRSWGDYTPGLDETITVTGTVSSHSDVHGKPFLCLEPVEVRRSPRAPLS